MPFVPEDGTGLSNANSYASVEFADAYFATRGITTWYDLPVEEKEFCLVRATDYIEMRWADRFRGKADFMTQSLSFPRDYWVGIPENLKKATSEYALRASVAPLAPDLEQDPSGFQVSRKIEKVGPLEERTDYAFLGPGAVRQLLRAYPAADMLMRPLLRGITGRVIRG